MAGKRSYYSHLGAGARILEQTAVTSVVQHPASVYRKTAPIVGPHIRAQRPTTGIDWTLPPPRNHRVHLLAARLRRSIELPRACFSIT